MQLLTPVFILVKVFLAQAIIGSDKPQFPTYSTATHPHLVRFDEVSKSVHQKRLDDGRSYSVNRQTFRSPAMPLAAGEVVFTDPKRTMLSMPKGKIAILSYHAEVVNETGASVPLNEVYNHHWLVFDGKENAGVCGGYLAYKFGVGAESRNTEVKYPDGYGLVTKGDEVWGANIHLLRTVDLANGAQGTKDCIECNYYPGRGCEEGEDGTFACCPDGSFCKTQAGTNQEKKKYFLQYTVSWTVDVASVKPVAVYVLDASDCQIEFNVKENPQNYVATQFDWKIPVNGEIVLSIGHQHIGGSNISLLVGPSKNNLTNVCTSEAKYGTSMIAGNEKGYVVGMGTCSLDKDSDHPFSAPVKVQKGDTLRVLSYYNVDPADQRSLPIPGGNHGGVMTLFYVVASQEGGTAGTNPVASTKNGGF